ncbi:MAG TPA: SPOR domain-containing protein [Pinirhizobacter sp.]|uniref:SPOR domain-containing protein n=1 Tax=Pinirhizobacter sp. TaxID=2950432 RepID=UPI002CC14158|nr:SPOR domain-containing protein [Pinirhizobacter sp.]HMH68753.1 SPOR domain-containing protein [Pinirhizobacter sp.]
MKTRLLGAAVLLALAVIVVPMLFSSAPPKTDAEQSLSLEIPAAPDRDLQSRTLDVSSPGGAPAAARTAFGTPPATSVTPGNGSQLASVDIASRRPPDVEANAPAATPAGPTPSTAPSAAPARAPVNKPSAATPAAAPAPAAPLPTGTAARGSFSVNLSAYADRGKADALVQKVRAMGYPASTAMVTQAGKQLTRVNAGPFDTRTAAEAARLKIKSAVPGVPASLSGQVADQKGDAPAVAAAAPRASAAAPAAVSPAPGATSRAGGWAVQLGAFSNEADANKLRDKVRGAGVAGYVDGIASSTGARLWRVRAGPQTQRDDAVRIRDQLKAKLGVDGNVVTVP